MNPQEAKDFFIQRIISQAQSEQAPLLPIEEKMLQWTEVHPIPGIRPDDLPAIAAEFSTSFDDQQWEQKITGLIRRAYEQDLRSDSAAKQHYKDALKTLKREDHYIVVMLESALR